MPDSLVVAPPAAPGSASTQFDVPEMLSVYETQANYEIVDSPQGDDRCFLFFSSNGLYYPNTASEFHRRVVEGNRYEWKRNVPPGAGRIVYLRDVTKSWYIEGINGRLNTVERLAEFLADVTTGYRVVCVGNSAGGYAAALFGTLLQASHVFDFSGQFSLLERLDDASDRALNPTLVRHEHDDDYRRYYSLRDLVAVSATPIFYFYPAHCAQDVEQAALVEGCDAVRSFAFASSDHASTCMIENYVPLFGYDRDRLCALHDEFVGSVIAPVAFSSRTCGVAHTFGVRLKGRAKRFMRGHAGGAHTGGA